jgi:hypothetical protein
MVASNRFRPRTNPPVSEVWVIEGYGNCSGIFSLDGSTTQ